MKETDWRAHARPLHALMQPIVDMRHTLADTIAVTELVNTARSLACVESGYPFEELPGFLK